MRSRTITLSLLAAAAVLAASPGAVGAQVYMEGPMVAGGSWSWGFGSIGWDFDQLVWVYRPDLDTGGGAFESPYVNTFTLGVFWLEPDPEYGPHVPATSWSLDTASPYYVMASGDATGSSTWFSWRPYFTGTYVESHTGFNLGMYKNGVWVDGFAITAGQNPDGSSAFSAPTITESEFNSYPPVPEPAYLTLVGLGFAAAMLFRRKRARH